MHAQLAQKIKLDELKRSTLEKREVRRWSVTVSVAPAAGCAGAAEGRQGRACPAPHRRRPDGRAERARSVRAPAAGGAGGRAIAAALAGAPLQPLRHRLPARAAGPPLPACAPGRQRSAKHAPLRPGQRTNGASSTRAHARRASKARAAQAPATTPRGARPARAPAGARAGRRAHTQARAHRNDLGGQAAAAAALGRGERVEGGHQVAGRRARRQQRVAARVGAGREAQHACSAPDMQLTRCVHGQVSSSLLACAQTLPRRRARGGTRGGPCLQARRTKRSMPCHYKLCMTGLG